MKITDGPYAPNRGITLAILILIALALFVMLGGTGCAPASDAALCDQVRAGGLIQTGDSPVTFDVVVNRNIVMRGITAELIIKECQ